MDSILTHLREEEQNIPTLPLLVPPTCAPPGALPLFAGKWTKLAWLSFEQKTARLCTAELRTFPCEQTRPY
jgi:hypothetical protein